MPARDNYFARKSGFPAGYDFGGQRISWVAHLLTDWCGDDGALIGMKVRLRRPILLGDVTWFTGKITNKHKKDGKAFVDCEIVGTNQFGEDNTTATATIELPTRG